MDFGVHWDYPDWKRLACSSGERYKPKEKVLAFLISYAIRSAKQLPDKRNDLVNLAIIYWSVVSAGLNPDELFLSVAAISPAPVAHLLRSFLDRKEADRSPKVFRLRLVRDSAGETEIAFG